MAGGQGGGGSKANRPLTGGVGGMGGGQMQPWGAAAQQGSFNGATPQAFGSVFRTFPQGGGNQGNPAAINQQFGLGQGSQMGGQPQGGGGPMPGWNVPANGGWNNWRMAGDDFTSGTPGPISQENYNYLNKRENILQNRVQNYRQRMPGPGGANRQGYNFLRGKLGDLRQYQNWRGQPGAADAGGAGAGAVDPVTGQPTTPAVDPVTGEPIVGLASDTEGNVTGAGGAGGVGAYSADFDPRTAGMPTRPGRGRLDNIADAMAARRKMLLGSGTGQQDQRYKDMAAQRQQLGNRFGNRMDQFRDERGTARDANMQTLLSAQSAGQTLTPEQLDWLTKMQGKTNAV